MRKIVHTRDQPNARENSSEVVVRLFRIWLVETVTFQFSVPVSTKKQRRQRKSFKMTAVEKVDKKTKVTKAFIQYGCLRNG